MAAAVAAAGPAGSLIGRRWPRPRCPEGRALGPAAAEAEADFLLLPLLFDGKILAIVSSGRLMREWGRSDVVMWEMGGASSEA